MTASNYNNLNTAVTDGFASQTNLSNLNTEKINSNINNQTNTLTDSMNTGFSNSTNNINTQFQNLNEDTKTPEQIYLPTHIDQIETRKILKTIFKRFLKKLGLK